MTIVQNSKQDKTRVKRSICPISIGLEQFGDKWTLLLIRDLMFGAKRFKDFETRPEKIPTNILASRLKMLEQNGLVEKNLYQERPKRYEYSLLDKGRDVIPVLQTIAKWSIKHDDESYQPSEKFWTADKSEP